MFEDYYTNFTNANKFETWLQERSKHSAEDYRLIFNTKRYLEYLSHFYEKYNVYLAILSKWCKDMSLNQLECKAGWHGKYVYMFISTNNGIKPCYVIYKNGVYMGLEK